MSERLIYHVCKADEWEAARRAGRYPGSSQVVASVAKHRAGQDNLIILEVDSPELGPALRWEPSRGGALFPHLYADLPLTAVKRFAALPLGSDGRHVFPWGL